MLLTALKPQTNKQQQKYYIIQIHSHKIHILHFGKENPFVKNYLALHHIEESNDFNKIDSLQVVDIILVNRDLNINFSVSDFKGKTTIYYTSSLSSSENDKIHYAAIPSLIQYTLQIKKNLNVLHSKSTSIVAKNKESEKFIKQVCICMDTHLDDHKFKLKQLCDCLSISRSTLHKKISAYTGQNTTQFINCYKLKKSKHLLVTTTWQISHIADILGYSSQHYFSRIFKKNEGISPLQYRNFFKNSM